MMVGMRRMGMRKWLALVAMGVMAFAASGCATSEPLSDNDQRVIAQLTEIAPLDAEIESEVTKVECWKPSENMIEEDVFRVICRMHFEEGGNDRYRDSICIGDPNADPVTDYCYLWAYYSDMPRFEDQPGHTAA